MAVFERDSPTPDGGVEDTETGPEVKVVKPQRSGRPSIFPAVADPAVGTGKVHVSWSVIVSSWDSFLTLRIVWDEPSSSWPNSFNSVLTIV